MITIFAYAAFFKIRHITHFAFETISGYDKFTKKRSLVFEMKINENKRRANEIIVFEKIEIRRFEILKTENSMDNFIGSSLVEKMWRCILGDKSWTASNNFHHHSSIWLTGRLKRYIHWTCIHFFISFFVFLWRTESSFTGLARKDLSINRSWTSFWHGSIVYSQYAKNVIIKYWVIQWIGKINESGNRGNGRGGFVVYSFTYLLTLRVIWKCVFRLSIFELGGNSCFLLVLSVSLEKNPNCIYCVQVGPFPSNRCLFCVRAGFVICFVTFRRCQTSPSINCGVPEFGNVQHEHFT